MTKQSNLNLYAVLRHSVSIPDYNLSGSVAGAVATAKTRRMAIQDGIDCPQVNSLNYRGRRCSGGQDILNIELLLGCHYAAASLGDTL
jgi:hypothetical protein